MPEFVGSQQHDESIRNWSLSSQRQLGLVLWQIPIVIISSYYGKTNSLLRPAAKESTEYCHLIECLER